MTALHMATLEVYLALVQYLCGQGADEETRGGSGMTPLHWATERKHTEFAIKEIK